MKWQRCTHTQACDFQSPSETSSGAFALSRSTPTPQLLFMSWLFDPSGDGSRVPVPTEELVEDPSDPSRKVRRKAANQPFLAYV